MKWFFMSLFLCGFAFGETHTIERSQNNKVSWTAIGSPGFLQIDGEGGYVEGTLKDEGGKVSGIFTCELTKFKTGMTTRDKHMKNDYLHVKKFPTAKLVLDPVETSRSFDFTGELTLHGVTKKVKGKGNLKKVGSTNVITAKMTLILTDYNIEIPSYLGVTVAKNVDLEVHLAY